MREVGWKRTRDSYSCLGGGAGLQLVLIDIILRLILIIHWKVLETEIINNNHSPAAVVMYIYSAPSRTDD